MKRLTPAVFLGTFLALFCSTASMIGVVSLGTSHYEELIHQEGKGIIGFEFGKEKEGHPKDGMAEERSESEAIYCHRPSFGFHRMDSGGSDYLFDRPVYPSAAAGSIETGERNLMIQLSYLDYSAVEGKSRLHRFSPKLKIIGMAFVLLGVVTMSNLPGLLLLYILLLTLFLTSRVPLKIFSLTLYPLLFAFLFILISGFKSTLFSSSF